MLGWLIVNGFLESKKFDEIYSFLKNASRCVGITLEIKTNVELMNSLDDQYMIKPDLVLFWDKDVYLAKRLEGLGIRLFNSAASVEICDNKILTALTLQGNVKTPKTVIAPKTFEGVGYTKKDFLKKAIEILSLPVVIKEAYGSFGQQVYLAKTLSEAEAIVDKLGHKEFLLQEFVKTSEGRDVRVNVVGGKVVSSMLRYNENDFRSNITNGGSMKKYDISPAWADAAVKACETIGLDFAGVDVMFGENDEPMICEVNSNPHFKSSFECNGVDMSMCIMSYVKEQMQ
ncbi:MAG: RimK family alpha-L-glutamate ligase [Clostridia bacterium]|nr:RimK family alpha-L-glutamate ligase [Clostridia bacterium]MBQ6905738.1 RimK family alpha-L-glutamate ligase [Clostridia bacterium]